MRIQHNISALNSYRQLGGNNNAVAKNLEKLSSGFRINRAGDDAAGLAISEKMRAQITSLETAQKNAQDGISLVQTAEGALTEVHSMLNRMVELAGQSANGTYQNAVDRENLQKEMSALTSEIDRIADGTNFNGIKLLDGSMDGRGKAKQTGIGGAEVSVLSKEAGVKITITAASDGTTIGNTAGEKGIKAEKTADGHYTITLGATSKAGQANHEYTAAEINEALKKVTQDVSISLDKSISLTSTATQINAGNTVDITTALGDGAKALTLQIGESAEDFNKLDVSVGSMKAEDLGIAKVDISTQEGAAAAVDALKNAINSVSSTRGDLGALQNRLEHTINNLGVTAENMTAAESRIRDVDMAKEMMTFTKNNILVQASQSMLAQANQQPQGVLQLLR